MKIVKFKDCSFGIRRINLCNLFTWFSIYEFVDFADIAKSTCTDDDCLVLHSNLIRTKNKVEQFLNWVWCKFDLSEIDELPSYTNMLRFENVNSVFRFMIEKHYLDNIQKVSLGYVL